jgi:uncharacterized membrane protein YeaQ/YmgE (transglycosylase-associated protein family)
MSIDLTGLIAWLAVALPAGLGAAWFMPGRGFGLVGDTAIGFIGAVAGGYTAALLKLPDQAAWLVVLLGTVAGAVLLTRLARLARARVLPRRTPA